MASQPPVQKQPWEMTAEEMGLGGYGYNAGDPTAFRNMDPSVMQTWNPNQMAWFAMNNIDRLDYRTPESAYNQWLAWDKWRDPSCPPGAPYRAEDGSGCVEKPDNSNAGYQAAGGGGGGGGGRGGGGRGGGGYGGGMGTPVPEFKYTAFQAPSYQEAMSDPGYQFSVEQGQDALQKSAAAKGLLRSGGTLRDIIGYGQDRAAQQYQDVYNRALQTWGAQYQGEKDAFAPQYGGWQTQYAGDLSRWTTNKNTELQKYLQREGNIYGLLNPQMPQW